MKIAIISDVHGNLEALKAVINDTKNKGVEKIFCLGDTIAKGPHSKECIELVKQKCDVVVRGNCDRHFSGVLDKEKVKERLKEKAQIEIDRWDNLNEILTEEEKQYLNKLPYSHEFYLSGSLVRMFHASPERDNLVVINQDFLETKYKMNIVISADNSVQCVSDYRIERTKIVKPVEEEKQVQEAPITEQEVAVTEENQPQETAETEAKENGKHSNHRRRDNRRRSRNNRRDKNNYRDNAEKQPKEKQEAIILYNSHEDITSNAMSPQGEEEPAKEKSTWWKKLIKG